MLDRVKALDAKADYLAEFGNYREIRILAQRYKDEQMLDAEVIDRLELMNNGVIFYPARFFSAFKYWLKKLVTGRCVVCGKYHYGSKLWKFSENHIMHCTYGWRWTLRHGFSSAVAFGQNGDD